MTLPAKKNCFGAPGCPDVVGTQLQKENKFSLGRRMNSG